jgi:hypothetical protein
MELDQIIRGLENHQGKWMTIYNNKIVVAETEGKLRAKVPASCEVKQIPAMVYGRTTWSNAVSTIVQSLSEKQPPADVLREEKQEEAVVVDERREPERRGFFARLFGKGRKKQEQDSYSYSSDAEIVYGDQ